MQLLLATRSSGKLRELRALFAGTRFQVVDLRDVGIAETAAENIVEQFETFEENALAKARYFWDLTRLPTIADDSGLCVDALGGAPGVRSKRWSDRPDLAGQALDDANNAKLVSAVRQLPEIRRSARYVCVAAFTDGKRVITSRGESEGRIIVDPSGAGGFGYDPYFYSSDLGMTFAEATLEAKEEVSHRGRAFRALLSALEGSVPSHASPS
jgi:XTP/dITP diphosphohydrolase